MALYNTDDGADNNIGYDIDNQSFNVGGVNYGTYDVVKRPIFSGSTDNYIIPKDPDLGVPTMQDNGNYGMNSFYDSRQGHNEPLVDDMLENNGRVRDIMNTGKINLPKLPDNILFHDNQETAVKGLLDETYLSQVFFSDANMDALQMSIRYGVHQRTNQVISKQSSKELYIIMRSIMLQYGNFKDGLSNAIEEAKKLNAKVITYCVDNISSNLLQHIKYLDDISKLPPLMERPMYLNKDNYTYDISNLL